jgi:hypothetical protein
MSVRELQPQYLTCVISNGQTTSGVVDLPNGYALVAIVTPSVLDNATLTFQAQADGSNWVNVFYEGTQYSITAATNAARHIALDPRVFASADRLRIVMGGSAAADRTIGLVYRPIN